MQIFANQLSKVNRVDLFFRKYLKTKTNW